MYVSDRMALHHLGVSSVKEYAPRAVVVLDEHVEVRLRELRHLGRRDFHGHHLGSKDTTATESRIPRRLVPGRSRRDGQEGYVERGNNVLDTPALRVL